MAISIAERFIPFTLFKSNKLPMIRQTEASECGLACLAMISGYYGFKTNLVSLRRRFTVTLAGLTLLDLINYAQQLQLTGRAVKVPFEQLEKLNTPSILHWNMNHFVVLKSVSKNTVIIHDPARGELHLSKAQASRSFTGIALELQPTAQFKPATDAQQLSLASFWRNSSGLGKSFTLIFSLSILLQIFVLAAPYYIQLVIDNVILSSDNQLLKILAIGFLLLLIFEVATLAIRSFAVIHLGNHLNLQLAYGLFSHLLRLPLDYFQKRHTGDLISRFGSLHKIKEMLTSGVIETLIDGLMSITTLIMMLVYAPSLTLLVISAVILYTLLRLLMYRSLHRASEVELIAKAEENSHFLETLRGMQSIKLFGLEGRREGIWQNIYANSVNQGIAIQQYDAIYHLVNRLIFGLENLLVIYIAAQLILDGEFSVGMLFAFVAYKRRFVDNSTRLIERLIDLKMLKLHVDRLADIVLTEQETSSNLLSDNRHQLQGELQLTNVSFNYYSQTQPMNNQANHQSHQSVLNQINLSIQVGESVAIVGPSGCGKTTLIKLMLGLLHPDHGTITYDGKTIETIGLDNFRSQIGAVMQDDQLFAGSIADNIGLFGETIDLEKIIECAKMASIDQDIQSLPMGYQTQIGDINSTLSGGQKQRVILARALYRQPRILFLDEATSHLDVDKEYAVNDAIKNLKITRIIIAHRPETITSADRIIQLNKV